MIVKEFFRERNDGVKLYRTYSDQNLMIRKLGTEEVYDEAIDVSTAAFVYVETETKILTPDTEETATATKAETTE